MKKVLHNNLNHKYDTLIHMTAASVGETTACLIRVPIEVVKQRRQALTYTTNSSFLNLVWDAYKTEGLFRGMKY